MNIRSQLICAWCGPAFAVLFAGGGFLIGGFLPPHSPSALAPEIASIYADSLGRIRLGMVLAMYATGFYGAWVAAIFVLMRRIEGTQAPVLSIVQLVSGTTGITVFLLPPLFWLTAAFRTENTPELILALNDYGWIYLTFVVAPFIFQYLALGLVVLQDNAPQPLLPRWMGYLAIWSAIIFIPAGTIPFFKAGPFAWNGFIAFWLPAGTFFATIFVMTFQFVRAIRNTAYQRPAST